ncbi:MAG: hypothetical protein M3139_16190 [Bacteroidota bacterium]|nr:hypothetical protein [Bacteroidota bacterium]
MNTAAKIHLSKLEKELVENGEWILTKQLIITKVYQLFGDMLDAYKRKIIEEKHLLPSFFKTANGKISKGENYEGLPYVILDYPGLFSKENIFAIRTMFWWGNFFSISLHISGNHLSKKTNFLKALNYLQENNFFICVNENEWEHSFEPSNYLSAAEIDGERSNEISKKPFFKISKKIGMNQWDDAPEFLENTFVEILNFITISFPNGEIILSPGFPKAVTDL